MEFRSRIGKLPFVICIIPTRLSLSAILAISLSKTEQRKKKKRTLSIILLSTTP
jgi:hypothetical protein